MNEVRKPLKRSILTGVILLLVSLCAGLCVLQYFSIRHSLYQSYENYIGSVLRYTASRIDTDDLAECIRTGKESPKFDVLQSDLNRIRDCMDIRFLYVVVPLNTEPEDNLKNVIAAVSPGEGEPDIPYPVPLNGLTGSSYPPATAQKYLDAFLSGEQTFFEAPSERGVDLTGLLPLKDSAGTPVAALCVDIDVSSIRGRILEHFLNTCLIVFTIGLLFASVFIVWADKSILRPIRTLEKGMARITREGGDPPDPASIVLDFPGIPSGNEVGALARSAEKTSRELQAYMENLVAKEKELVQMSANASRDELTHVGTLNAYNRYAEQLQREMSEGSPEFAILMADVDDLKQKNDDYGHERGSLYLKNCCAVICDVFRHSPVFRVGGDEFAVVLRGPDYENRRNLLRNARARFRQSCLNENVPPWERMSVSIGISDYNGQTDKTVEEILTRADKAMYEARNLKTNNQ